LTSGDFLLSLAVLNERGSYKGNQMRYRLTFIVDTEAYKLDFAGSGRHTIPFSFKSGEVVELFTDTPTHLFEELNQVFFYNDEDFFKIEKKNIKNFTYELIGV